MKSIKCDKYLSTTGPWLSRPWLTRFLKLPRFLKEKFHLITQIFLCNTSLQQYWDFHVLTSTKLYFKDFDFRDVLIEDLLFYLGSKSVQNKQFSLLCFGLVFQLSRKYLNEKNILMYVNIFRFILLPVDESIKALGRSIDLSKNSFPNYPKVLEFSPKIGGDVSKLDRKPPLVQLNETTKRFCLP